MTAPFKSALVGLLAVSTATPALAQYTPPQYEREVQRYQNEQERYRDQQERYEERREGYDQRRDDYADARRNYERQRADYERARADYDRRYGVGAYARRYGAAPVWDANRYGRNASYNDDFYDASCRDRRTNNATAGGIIGALAGAALGRGVASRGNRAEGTVLGAVVGGAAGVAIGRSTAKCDDRGYYYSYSDTVPYRESDYDRGRRSGRYDYTYYNRQGCRLAPAPVNGDEYRYVRVCPDRQGRYRITS
jgi:uncharacterized protein YcfJ